MAKATITPQILTKWSEPATGAATTSMVTALTAEGGSIDWNFGDQKAILLVQNTGSAPVSVTVKAGGGIQGTADLTFSVTNAQYTFLGLESGRFKQVAGDDKGKIIITGSADIKVAVFVLP